MQAPEPMKTLTLIERLPLQQRQKNLRKVTWKIAIAASLMAITANMPAAEAKDEVLQEFQTYDKDVRLLTYKILLEKFNGKYSGLYESQKEVLKEFITSVDSTPKLRTFYNNRIKQLKEELATINKTITDKAVQIKLHEVLPLIVEIEKNHPIRNENIVDLLQYCELVEELKSANGQTIK
jgi:hypothetical protein